MARGLGMGIDSEGKRNFERRLLHCCVTYSGEK